jgi:hypothetical protein
VRAAPGVTAGSDVTAVVIIAIIWVSGGGPVNLRPKEALAYIRLLLRVLEQVRPPAGTRAFCNYRFTPNQTLTCPAPE